MKTTNQLYKLRTSRGISAAHLAEIAGISRQTIYAIEAGDYMPNTAVALMLARELGVRVEDLFQIEAAAPQSVKAELLDPTLRPGQPVRICQVGKKIVAVPAATQPVLLPEMNAILGERSAVQALPDDENSSRIVIAGCDPAVSILAGVLRGMNIDLIAAPANSRKALQWLKRGLAHVAGSHLKSESGEYNLPLVKKMFGAGAYVVTFAVWEQGFVVAPGNPKSIRSIEALARPNVSLINREEGSGSRDLLDAMLKAAGISSKKLAGYNRSAAGHLAAAMAVSNGDADTCIATRSAAQTFGLEFVAVASERYDFVIPAAHFQLPAVQSMLDALTRSSLRNRLRLAAGYDTTMTGTVTLV